MTKFTDKQIKQMNLDVLGKKVTDFYYESEGNYFVMEFEDEIEICFKFMAP